MVDHIITAKTPDGIWLLGKIDEYDYQAKVCDEASGFGIDCGRVIKLHAFGKSRGQELFAYERGWDKYPKGKHKGLAQALIRFCESLPEQDTWRNTFRTERRFLVTEDDVLEYEDDNP